MLRELVELSATDGERLAAYAEAKPLLEKAPQGTYPPR
jgi:hypothetical protein